MAVIVCIAFDRRLTMGCGLFLFFFFSFPREGLLDFSIMLEDCWK